VRVVVLAGPAGAGKSTLGAALARRTGATLLDLDTVTGRLLDEVFPATGLPGHWNEDRHRHLVRPARYAALLAVAGDQLRLDHDVVLTAPFSRELRGGRVWEALQRSLSPVDPLVVWLHAAPEVLSRRLAERAEPRDAVRHARRSAAPVPRVAHLRLEATTPTHEQVRSVLATFAARPPADCADGVD
jgi:sugar-phosphatase